LAALVVLDTNALLMPFERRVRIEEELERLLGPFEALVPTPCIQELERIASEERGGRRDRAKMALQYATRFQRVEHAPPADYAALRIAVERGACLFTNDAELVKRAHRQGVRVIRLKGLSHLVIHPDLDA
jgi:uncharacterized protein